MLENNGDGDGIGVDGFIRRRNLKVVHDVSRQKCSLAGQPIGSQLISRPSSGACKGTVPCRAR
jgi:hypothetical protein